MAAAVLNFATEIERSAGIDQCAEPLAIADRHATQHREAGGNKRAAFRLRRRQRVLGERASLRFDVAQTRELRG